MDLVNHREAPSIMTREPFVARVRATLFDDEVYSLGNEMVDVFWYSRPLVHFAAHALAASVKLDSDYSRTGHQFFGFASFVEDFCFRISLIHHDYIG